MTNLAALHNLSKAKRKAKRERGNVRSLRRAIRNHKQKVCC